MKRTAAAARRLWPAHLDDVPVLDHGAQQLLVLRVVLLLLQVCCMLGGKERQKERSSRYRGPRDSPQTTAVVHTPSGGRLLASPVLQVKNPPIVMETKGAITIVCFYVYCVVSRDGFKR